MLAGEAFSLPLAELYSWTGGYPADTPLELTPPPKPDHNVPYSREMYDVDEHDALTAVYSAAIANFGPDSGSPLAPPGTPSIVEEEGASTGTVVGYFFLGLFLGPLLVAGLFVMVTKLQEGGLDGLCGFCAETCRDAWAVTCGAVSSHAGYGQLAGGEAADTGTGAHPPGSFGAQLEVLCNTLGNWRAWIPGTGPQPGSLLLSHLLFPPPCDSPDRDPSSSLPPQTLTHAPWPF